MKRSRETGPLIAENFWQLKPTNPYEAPACERTEARFLAYAYALSQQPSVFAPIVLVHIAEDTTALSLQKISLEIKKPGTRKKQRIQFGLDTRIVLTGFLAGTIFDLDPTFKAYRPLFYDPSLTLKVLSGASNRIEKQYYQQAHSDLSASRDPIQLLARYLNRIGIQADEAQMKINADRFLSL